MLAVAAVRGGGRSRVLHFWWVLYEDLLVVPYKDLGVSVDNGSQLNSLFQKVCAILTNYLICNVPAATVLAVDPNARGLSKVHKTLLHININSFLIMQPSRLFCNRCTFPPMCWHGWASLSTRCFMCFAIQRTGLRNKIFVSAMSCFNMFQDLILGAIEPIT